MATVSHPVFPDQKHVVPDDDVKSWTDQGWKKVSSKDTIELGKSSFEEALDVQDTEGVVEVVPVSFQPSTAPITVTQDQEA